MMKMRLGICGLPCKGEKKGLVSETCRLKSSRRAKGETHLVEVLRDDRLQSTAPAAPQALQTHLLVLSSARRANGSCEKGRRRLVGP